MSDHIKATGSPATEIVTPAEMKAAGELNLTETARLMKRAAALEDLARNVAALDESGLLSADLNFYRATIREWRKQARELMQ